MTCRALLFTANTTAQAVAIGGLINPGSVVRRRSGNCSTSPSANISGSTVTLTGGDYYDVGAVLTVVPTAAGTVTVSLVQDGVNVESASATVAAAATSIPITLRGIVRTRGGSSNITIVLTGAAASVSSAYVVVEQD